MQHLGNTGYLPKLYDSRKTACAILVIKELMSKWSFEAKAFGLFLSVVGHARNEEYTDMYI